MSSDWELRDGGGPLIATAIHAGHALRPDVARLLRLGDADRRREEDPFTDDWVDIAPTSIAVLRSRFEVDLNRPRDAALYETPEQAWGMDLWDGPVPTSLRMASLETYDAFYAQLHDLLERAQARHGRFVVFDLHSYNHRRGGPGAEPDDPRVNPDINLGTGSMDRERWATIVDTFLDDLRAADLDGHALDVRENVRFQGGHMARWVHEQFPDTGCVLAIEVKKFFMDEHRGEIDPRTHKAVREALSDTVPGMLDALRAQ